MQLATSCCIFFYWLYIQVVNAQIGRKSVEECRSYRGIRDSYIVFPMIVGGTRAEEYEFPHMAALGYGNERNWTWLCGGTLISENFVLTAAHCLYSRTDGYVKIVRLGTNNIVNPEPSYEDCQITKKIAHPNYKFATKYNDIALLRLDRYLNFSRKIRPACLQVHTDFDPTTMTATGWGSETANGPPSPYLLKVQLVLYSNMTCQVYYKNRKTDLPNGIQEQSMICAGGERNETRDTCFGDSGGPLQIFQTQYYVVGVTSFGPACGYANVPAIYTRVSDYIGWIEENVWI